MRNGLYDWWMMWGDICLDDSFVKISESSIMNDSFVFGELIGGEDDWFSSQNIKSDVICFQK